MKLSTIPAPPSMQGRDPFGGGVDTWTSAVSKGVSADNSRLNGSRRLISEGGRYVHTYRPNLYTHTLNLGTFHTFTKIPWYPPFANDLEPSVSTVSHPLEIHCRVPILTVKAGHTLEKGVCPGVRPGNSLKIIERCGGWTQSGASRSG